MQKFTSYCCRSYHSYDNFIHCSPKSQLDCYTASMLYIVIFHNCMSLSNCNVLFYAYNLEHANYAIMSSIF